MRRFLMFGLSRARRFEFPVGERERHAVLIEMRREAVFGVFRPRRYRIFKQALTRIWDLVRRSNAYVDERAPWKLAKAAEGGDDAASATLDTTLHHLVAAVRQLGALVLPFLPGPGAAVLAALGSSAGSVPPAASWLDGIQGTRVEKPPALFPRLELREP
ncbi:hypothetical protein [Rhizomonospora bruguierae]|uniref:hypothetical protein n=1 Tax=Rhizomonospora bruguierae TaxID=1581705 RepID=UPI001BCCBFC0|nr:hypothetical protein [Micromonospora sp. NBRC 107566]